MDERSSQDSTTDPKDLESEESQIEQDFEERQQMANESSEEELEEDLKYTSVSPELTGGDLDADWQAGNASGEETVGGTTPTPDQDMVDELGEAVGLTYRGGEPLDIEDKLEERDRNREELDPESREDDPSLDSLD